MTLKAFDCYIQNNKPTKIVFDTDNQNWDYAPMRFSLSFSKIGIHYAPDRIFLTGEETQKGNINFQSIKRIRVNENDIFTTATITCGTVDRDTDYTFRLLLYS